MQEKENNNIENNSPFNSNFVKEGRFYIFGEINESIPESIIAPLISEINRKAREKKPLPIEIYINSTGGYLSFAFDIITQFDIAEKKGVPIYTYVTASACSAASLIAVCGHKRFVGQRAYHLLHFARGADYSHNPVMIDRNAENFKFLQSELVKIYEKKTKLKDVASKLLPDNFMVNGSKDLIKFGLADEAL